MEIQLSDQVAERLEKYAEDTGRSIQQVADDVLTRYLHYVDRLEQDILEAKAEADRDGWLTTEEAFAQVSCFRKKSA